MRKGTPVLLIGSQGSVCNKPAWQMGSGRNAPWKLKISVFPRRPWTGSVHQWQCTMDRRSGDNSKAGGRSKFEWWHDRAGATVASRQLSVKLKFAD